MGKVELKARFSLCPSTVRRARLSPPNLCLFHCPSSVRACFRCFHWRLQENVADSRKKQCIGVTKGPIGVTGVTKGPIRVSIEPCSGLG